ncbi:pseudouridine synthase [Pseudomonas putida]|uniref:pseudouridine synthase n=1 Tax=Pseudomonas putida TaxID=303 RepID=UPI00081921D2|nr:pseudouridine synthase [Pseudomonas putida]OCT20814.1 pseudouridine synthase [Pseudomonas putida]OCT29245.1 pseudouridine synthase [Pseudomonas putida]OCT35419.1 pseudouridine synthase [Pseudomonas putida]OCT39596.1 pseudouridine synthase [Pseudomonas putida]
MSTPFDPAHQQASTVCLPPGDWITVLDCLCDHFKGIGRDQWLDRFSRGRVLDAEGRAVAANLPYRRGMRLHYFREVPNERPIPVQETILHCDEHLVVADKPHFLPVTPTGGYVEHTLLRRLIRRLDNPHLVPLHRIDRHTAGLVLFSSNPQSRSAYQRLFPERRIDKRYHAIAAPLPTREFPLVHRSRLEHGEPFFRMREVEGVANSETLAEVLEKNGNLWRYELSPVTGKTHQLRVHMAALGAAISNDPFYPTLLEGEDDYERPLKLLAQSLGFDDPLTGEKRYFQSCLSLDW